MPLHEFIESVHETSKQRLDDDSSYRRAFTEQEEIGLRSRSALIEILLQRKVRVPLRISLGLILFLPNDEECVPLFWAGNDDRGSSHSSLIPEILSKLPPEHLRASVWATRQTLLDDGGASSHRASRAE